MLLAAIAWLVCAVAATDLFPAAIYRSSSARIETTGANIHSRSLVAQDVLVVDALAFDVVTDLSYTLLVFAFPDRRRSLGPSDPYRMRLQMQCFIRNLDSTGLGDLHLIYSAGLVSFSDIQPTRNGVDIEVSLHYATVLEAVDDLVPLNITLPLWPAPKIDEYYVAVRMILGPTTDVGSVDCMHIRIETDAAASNPTLLTGVFVASPHSLMANALISSVEGALIEDFSWYEPSVPTIACDNAIPTTSMILEFNHGVSDGVDIFIRFIGAIAGDPPTVRCQLITSIYGRPDVFVSGGLSAEYVQMSYNADNDRFSNSFGMYESSFIATECYVTCGVGESATVTMSGIEAVVALTTAIETASPTSTHVASSAATTTTSTSSTAATLPPEESCAGNCGEMASSCYCDSICAIHGDCCADYTTLCGSTTTTSSGPTVPRTSSTTTSFSGSTSALSCAGRCGGEYDEDRCGCYLNCEDDDDCCADYEDHCAVWTCGDDCFQYTGWCYCDPWCTDLEDCCADFDEVCSAATPDPDCSEWCDQSEECTCPDDCIAGCCPSFQDCVGPMPFVVAWVPDDQYEVTGGETRTTPADNVSSVLFDDSYLTTFRFPLGWGTFVSASHVRLQFTCTMIEEMAGTPFEFVALVGRGSTLHRPSQFWGHARYRHFGGAVGSEFTATFDLWPADVGSRTDILVVVWLDQSLPEVECRNITITPVLPTRSIAACGVGTWRFGRSYHTVTSVSVNGTVDVGVTSGRHDVCLVDTELSQYDTGYVHLVNDTQSYDVTMWASSEGNCNILCAIFTYTRILDVYAIGDNITIEAGVTFRVPPSNSSFGTLLHCYPTSECTLTIHSFSAVPVYPIASADTLPADVVTKSVNVKTHLPALAMASVAAVLAIGLFILCW